MTYEVALARFKAFGYEKCSDMEDRILEALEKQIPKKVVRKMGCHGGALCPNCRTMFEYRMDNWKSPFCQYCGQALKWNEVE